MCEAVTTSPPARPATPRRPRRSRAKITSARVVRMAATSPVRRWGGDPDLGLCAGRLPLSDRGLGGVAPPMAELRPRTRLEVVLIDAPVAVEREEIVLGCADLDQLGHGFLLVDLLQLPESPHTGELQALACLQEAGAARRGPDILRANEAGHRQIDPPERRVCSRVQLSPPSSQIGRATV